MIQIFDSETGDELGTLSEDHLKFLVDQLEEEYEEDQDYYINLDMLEAFADQGAEPALLEILRRALGDREEMEIHWLRT